MTVVISSNKANREKEVEVPSTDSRSMRKLEQMYNERWNTYDVEIILLDY